MFIFKRLRKEEVAALSGPNEFAEFYSRLRSLKDYHRKFPNEVYFAFIINFNPLSTEIHIQILQTNLHTFLLRVVERIWFKGIVLGRARYVVCTCIF